MINGITIVSLSTTIVKIYVRAFYFKIRFDDDVFSVQTIFCFKTYKKFLFICTFSRVNTKINKNTSCFG